MTIMNPDGQAVIKTKKFSNHNPAAIDNGHAGQWCVQIYKGKDKGLTEHQEYFDTKEDMLNAYPTLQHTEVTE